MRTVSMFELVELRAVLTVFWRQGIGRSHPLSVLAAVIFNYAA